MSKQDMHSLSKEALRDTIWARLEKAKAALSSPWSSTPNFVGAQDAAMQLIKHPAWQAANIIRTTPESAQGYLRLFALEQNKRVYMSVKNLAEDQPLILLDPAKLIEANIPFEDVMYADGAMMHGLPCDFENIEPVDLVLIGCVAVNREGARTGKGTGFADLEVSLLGHFKKISATTPIATTVHSVQVVDFTLPMDSHDTPVDIIATPHEVLDTNTRFTKAVGIDWSILQAEQLETIPLLKRLQPL